MLALLLLLLTPGAPPPVGPPDTAQESRHLRNIKRLTTEGRNGESYWSPDAQRIIFQSIRGDSPYYQIYSMAADGTDQRRISSGRGKTTCSYFHPSRAKVIFASTHADPKAF